MILFKKSYCFKRDHFCIHTRFLSHILDFFVLTSYSFLFFLFFISPIHLSLGLSASLCISPSQTTLCSLFSPLSPFPSFPIFHSLSSPPNKTSYISSVCKACLFVTLLWAPWIQPTALVYLMVFYNTWCLQSSALTNKQIVQKETLELNDINQTDLTDVYRKFYQNTKEHQQSIKLPHQVTKH